MGSVKGFSFLFFLCAHLSTWDYVEGIDLIIRDPVFKPFLNSVQYLLRQGSFVDFLEFSLSKKTNKGLGLSSDVILHFLSL